MQSDIVLGDAPDDFFDDEKERQQEILDMTTSVLSFRKGHTKIPLVKVCSLLSGLCMC